MASGRLLRTVPCQSQTPCHHVTMLYETTGGHHYRVLDKRDRVGDFHLHTQSTSPSSPCLLLLRLLHKITMVIPRTSKFRMIHTSGFPSSLKTFVHHALHSTHSPTMVTCKR